MALAGKKYFYAMGCRDGKLGQVDKTCRTGLNWPMWARRAYALAYYDNKEPAARGWGSTTHKAIKRIAGH